MSFRELVVFQDPLTTSTAGITYESLKTISDHLSYKLASAHPYSSKR